MLPDKISPAEYQALSEQNKRFYPAYYRKGNEIIEYISSAESQRAWDNTRAQHAYGCY